MRPAAYIQHHVMGEDDLVFDNKDKRFAHTPLYTKSPGPSAEAIQAARRILDPAVDVSLKEDLGDFSLVANEILKLAGKRK